MKLLFDFVTQILLRTSSILLEGKLRVDWTVYNLRGDFNVADGQPNFWVSPTKRIHGYVPLPDLINTNGNPVLANWTDKSYESLFGLTRP